MALDSHIRGCLFLLFGAEEIFPLSPGSLRALSPRRSRVQIWAMFKSLTLQAPRVIITLKEGEVCLKKHLFIVTQNIRYLIK